ncbi:hypothetical protein EAE96_006791 [Botrytis aclada]|nr:hypothetical protein EAE96_006791 [Botrytis aclada]
MFSQGQQNVLLCMDEVGAHIRQICTRGVCEILMQKLLEPISSIDRVDVIFQGERKPSLVEYWRRRDLTAGVYPAICILAFIHEIDITERSFQNLDFVNLWKHTSYIVHITNDMLSLKKEVRDNQIENLVPVLMSNFGSDSK